MSDVGAYSGDVGAHAGGVGAFATPGQRTARGKAARGQAPRSSHAAAAPPPDRDPVELLQRQAATRVPELVPIRYGRMLTSPFAFFRGAAAIMAHDLTGTPQTGLEVQLCGDAHLSNFGLFGTPERRLVFDVNDFDETLPGPWEWDIKRLAASLAVAGRDNGFGRADRQGIVRECVARYRAAMREFAAMTTLEVWYAEMDADAIQAEITGRLAPADHKRLSKTLAKARTHDSMQAMDKLTRVIDGERRIAGDPPLVVPLRDMLPGATREQLADGLRKLVHDYGANLQPERRALLEQFHLVDMARKVVGVGSVGTRAWILLLVGRDERDPLFLQAKEAQPSVLATFAGRPAPDHQGIRVVAGQRLIQAASDIFLGWHRFAEIDGTTRDFYVRQLRDWKASAEIETMTVNGMSWYGAMCGAALARAHARSGDRIAISGYLGAAGAFDRALVAFAEAYADQNERDHLALAAAVRRGRVPAEVGL